MSALDILELGAFVEMMRDAQLRLEHEYGADPIWKEAVNLRLEVRSAFIRKFFDAN